MYHVLRRHLTPRHSPCALRSFSRLLRRPRSSRQLRPFGPVPLPVGPQPADNRLFLRSCFSTRMAPRTAFSSPPRHPGFLRVYLSSYSLVKVPQIESGDRDRQCPRLSLSQNSIVWLVVNVLLATKRPGRDQARTWASRFPAHVAYVLTVAIVTISFPKPVSPESHSSWR